MDDKNAIAPSVSNELFGGMSDETRQRKIKFHRWNIEGLKREIAAKEEGLRYSEAQLVLLLTETKE